MGLNQLIFQIFQGFTRFVAKSWWKWGPKMAKLLKNGSGSWFLKRVFWKERALFGKKFEIYKSWQNVLGNWLWETEVAEKILQKCLKTQRNLNFWILKLWNFVILTKSLKNGLKFPYNLAKKVMSHYNSIDIFFPNVPLSSKNQGLSKINENCYG